MNHPRRIGALAGALLMANLPVSGQERSQARSMVISQHGIVATSQTLASQAGAQVLARGGSAMDAAIAANAVLGVVEPMSCGMGGDLFAHLLGRQDRQAHRAQCQRLGAQGADHRVSQGEESLRPCRRMAFSRSPCRAAWTAGRSCTRSSGACRGPICSGPRSTTRRTDFRSPRSSRSIGRDSYSIAEPGRERPPRLPARRLAPRRWARSSAIRIWPRPCELVAAGGADAFYRGPIAKAILKTSDRLGGTMAGGRPERIPRRMGASRSRPSIAAGRSTSCRPTARAWRRSRCSTSWRRFRCGDYAPVRRRRAALEDRSAEAGLCRSAALPGRSALRPGAGGELLSKEYAAERAALIDRAEGELPDRARQCR